MELLTTLLNNMLMMFSTIGLGSYLALKSPRQYVELTWGMVFGVATMMIMASKITLFPGYYIDFRNVPLTLAGVSGGPISAILAALIASIYRYIQGGAGMVPGIESIIIYACIGIWLRWKYDNRIPGAQSLLGIGLFLGASGLCLLMYLPPWRHPETIAAARMIVPEVMLLNPLAVVMSFKMFFFLREIGSRLLILESLLSTSPIQIVIVNVKGEMTFLNRTITDSPYFVPLVPKIKDLALNVIQSGQGCTIETDVTNAGEIRYYQMRAVKCWGYHSERAVMILLSNVTMERKMELQMAKMDRLNVIGQMAASVAHEIRNPMTAARGFVQYVADKREDCRVHLDVAIEELDRADTIINNFLAVSRDRFVQMEVCSLNDIVQSACKIIEADCLKRGVELKLHLDTTTPSRPYNKEEIKQLLYNMSLNALDAMERSSRKELYITTSLVGECTYLHIRDTGCGVQKTEIGKLFEPFYTTKKEGTGLGLAVCHSIVERHDGRLSVSSVNGSGTCFSIRFNSGT